MAYYYHPGPKGYEPSGTMSRATSFGRKISKTIFCIFERIPRGEIPSSTTESCTKLTPARPPEKHSATQHQFSHVGHSTQNCMILIFGTPHIIIFEWQNIFYCVAALARHHVTTASIDKILISKSIVENSEFISQ